MCASGLRDAIAVSSLARISPKSPDLRQVSAKIGFGIPLAMSRASKKTSGPQLAVPTKGPPMYILFAVPCRLSQRSLASRCAISSRPSPTSNATDRHCTPQPEPVIPSLPASKNDIRTTFTPRRGRPGIGQNLPHVSLTRRGAASIRSLLCRTETSVFR